MNNKKIGAFIAALRKEQKMTQEQLAEKLGVSNRSISRWENGNSMPDFSLMQGICEVFDITIIELWNGERNDGSGEEQDISSIVMELSDREKENKARKLNWYFSLGLLFLLVVIEYETAIRIGLLKVPFLEDVEIVILLIIGLIFEALGFYHNIKGSKEKTFTVREIEVLTNTEKNVKMKFAGEMLSFARKYQKAELKQYKRAFKEIAESLLEDEYAVFAMVCESYMIDESAGPWHVSIAVTNKRILLCGETISGRMFTRYVLDSFKCSDIRSVELVQRKIVFRTSKEVVKLAGQDLELVVERMRKAVISKN